MKLSVIIPIFNKKNTIEELVKSITACAEPEMEVILVDDGSADGSLGVCQKLAGSDKRINVLHKENGGVSSARNYGLDHAKGKYIYFCDSDDFVFTDVLTEAVSHLDINADVFVFDYIYRFLENGRIVKSAFKLDSDTVLQKQYITDKMIKPLVLQSGTDLASLWHKFFRRDIIEKNKIRFEEDVHKGEDWRFILDFLAVSETAYYIPRVLYEYRLDGSQVETKYKKEPGIHLLGSCKRKFELNKRFNLGASKAQIFKWYKAILDEVMFSKREGCNKRELLEMLSDKTVQESANVLLHAKKQDYIQSEVSRKYRIYALLIKCRMIFLLKAT